MFKFNPPKLSMNYKQPDNDGMKAVYWQCIINRKVKRLALNIRWSVKHWNQKQREILPITVTSTEKRALKKAYENDTLGYEKQLNQLVDVRNTQYRTAINRINKTRRIIEEIVKKYELYDKTLDAQTLEEEYYNFEAREGLSKDFIVFANHEVMERFRLGEISESSKKNHHSKIKKLSQFRPKIAFPQLNTKLLKEFKIWLTEQNFKLNYITAIFKTLSTYFDRAVEKKLISKNPMMTHGKKDKAFRMDYQPGERDVPLQSEIQKYQQYYYSNLITQSEKVVLRAYLFALVNGGIDFVDLYNLTTEDNLIENVLVYVRKKVKKYPTPVKIPQTEFSLSLIADSEKEYPGHIQLIKTFEHSQTHNKFLKDINEKLEIERHVTTKTARHYFATRALEQGEPIHHISKFMGHQKIETTIKFYDRSSPDNLRPSLENIQNNIL